jgi:hypothetical protein
MSIRPILTAVLFAAVLRASPAPAAEAGTAAPAEPPASGKLPGGDAREFAQSIYRTMSLGGKNAALPLADAIESEALLERALAGLSGRPPAEWRAAALARLDASREAMAGAVARFATGGLARALPAQSGPDGTTLVAVRLHLFTGQSFQTGWHRLTLRQKGAVWRVEEIEMLDSGDQLSNLAVAVICDPEKGALPAGSAAGALAAPVVELLGCIAAGLALGFVLRGLLLRRQAGGGAGAIAVAVGAIVGVVLGLVLFGIGMVRFMGTQGAVDEFQRRGASIAMARGDMEAAQAIVAAQNMQIGRKTNNVDAALEIWPQNRMAQMLKGTLATGTGKPEDAGGFLAALAQTSSPPPAVHLHLARLQEQARRWSEAAASRRKFAELLGGDALAWCEAARDLARAGDARGAEELLRAAEKTEPPDFRILMVRAEAHAALRKGPAAVADLKEFLASKDVPIDPRMVRALLEQDEEYKPVRGDPAVRAFLQELKSSGTEEAPVGPVRR